MIRISKATHISLFHGGTLLDPSEAQASREALYVVDAPVLDTLLSIGCVVVKGGVQASGTHEAAHSYVDFLFKDYGYELW